MTEKLTTEQMIYNDLIEVKTDVKNLLSRLPVVEEKCKQASKVTSIITSTIVSIFLTLTLTVLTQSITKAMMDKEKNENNKRDNITSHRD